MISNPEKWKRHSKDLRELMRPMLRYLSMVRMRLLRKILLNNWRKKLIVSRMKRILLRLWIRRLKILRMIPLRMWTMLWSN